MIESVLACDLWKLPRNERRAARAVGASQRETDAEATAIYSAAYSADPDFYQFLRTLQSYEKTLGEKTTFVLGADSEYFKLLK